MSRPAVDPAARMAERVARWKVLEKWDRPTLLSRVNELYRIHACDKRTSKTDLVSMIVNAELPMPRERRPR